MAHLPGSNNVFSFILLLFLRKTPSDWPYDATDALG